MGEWFYKATSKKVSFEPTYRLAVNDGFLCRSAYTINGPRVARTMAVKFNDIIHFYFSEKGNVRSIGSFEVIRKDEHPSGSRFGGMISKTNLFRVDDPAFEAELRELKGQLGYKPDPVEHCMTGWLLRKRTDVQTPTYQPEIFPIKTTLVRRQ